MPAIDANGLTLEYESTGSGDPILLIMGLGAQLTAWPDVFVDGLADLGHRVIRHDNRDVGLSSKLEGAPIPSPGRILAAKAARRRPPVAYFVDDMADDAAGLLDGLGIESAHVVGVSMGGMIAQSLAIRHGEKVRSLCSIMSNTGDGRRGSIAPRLLPTFRRLSGSARTPEEAIENSVRLFGLFSGPAFDPDEHRRRAIAANERSFYPEGTRRQSAGILASRDRTKRLRDVTAPTLVVHGLLDPLVRPSGGVATARAVPDARLVMFPDMGHDLPAPLLPEIVTAIHDNTQRAA